MSRTKTECLPSLEENHRMFLTCYEDFSYFDIWVWSFLSVYVIIFGLILVTVFYTRKMENKTVITYLIMIETFLYILYISTMITGLDPTDSFIPPKVLYIFPARTNYILLVVIWLEMLNLWRETINNIRSMTIRPSNSKKTYVVVHSVGFALSTTILSILSVVYQDTSNYVIFYSLNNAIIMFYVFAITITGMRYIYKLYNMSLPVVRTNNSVKFNFMEIKQIMLIIVVCSILTITMAITYQVSMFMNFWSPFLSMLYISVILVGYIIQIICSLVICNDIWKKYIRLLFGIRISTPKISPLISPVVIKNQDFRDVPKFNL